MQRFEAKSLSIYFIGLGGFIITLIFFPYVLGNLIATNQWLILGILVLGCTLLTLFFSEYRFMLFFTGLFLLLTASQVEWLVAMASPLRWIFLSAMVVTAIAQWFWSRNTQFKLLDVWALLFFALAFYSQTYSIEPNLTLERSLASLLFYFSLFWGVWNYATTPDRILKITQDFLRLVFFGFTIGLLWIEKGRFQGFFSNPNALGLFAALFLPITLWGFFAHKDRLSLYLSVVMTLSLLLSQSRASLLGALFGGGYFFLAYYQSKRLGIFLALFFLTGFMLLAIELFGAGFFQDYLRLDSLLVGSGRMEAWKEVFRLISLRPWLGYGYGTEDQLFEKFDIVFFEHAGDYAHNSYIGLVSQVGMLGGILFFLPFFVFLIRNMLLIHRIPPGDALYALRFALQGSILAGALNAFFESWLYSAGNPFAFFFWTLVVLAARATEMRSAEKEKVLSA